MTRYALVRPDNTVSEERDESRLDLSAGTKDGWRWLPIVPITDESGYTPGNQYFVTERADPYQVVEATRVTRTTIKRDMTAAEQDARIEQEIEGQFTRDLKNWALAITNEVRALQGKQPVTMAQLATYVRGLRG